MLEKLEKLENWFVKRKIENVVMQGNQDIKIETFFEQIIQSASDEYTEDNNITLRYFLEERFNNACDIILGEGK